MGLQLVHFKTSTCTSLPSLLSASLASARPHPPEKLDPRPRTSSVTSVLMLLQISTIGSPVTPPWMKSLTLLRICAPCLVPLTQLLRLCVILRLRLSFQRSSMDLSMTTSTHKRSARTLELAPSLLPHLLLLLLESIKYVFCDQNLIFSKELQ